MKNMLLEMSLSKVVSMINSTKSMKKSKSQPEETIAERVKFRRQKQMIKIYLTCHR